MGTGKERNAHDVPVHTMKVCRRWICTVPLILNVGARGEWVANSIPQPLSPWQRTPVQID